jgi:hypothetical protein
MDGSGPQILLADDSSGGISQDYGSFSHGGSQRGWAAQPSSAGAFDASLDSGGAPIKLFFGQVPRSLSDLEIREVFDRFGAIRDFVLLKFKDSGLSKGEQDAHVRLPRAAIVQMTGLQGAGLLRLSRTRRLVGRSRSCTSASTSQARLPPWS